MPRYRANTTFVGNDFRQRTELHPLLEDSFRPPAVAAARLVVLARMRIEGLTTLVVDLF